jgi:hypothetical protein
VFLRHGGVLAVLFLLILRKALFMRRLFGGLAAGLLALSSVVLGSSGSAFAEDAADDELVVPVWRYAGDTALVGFYPPDADYGDGTPFGPPTVAMGESFIVQLSSLHGSIDRGFAGEETQQVFFQGVCAPADWEEPKYPDYPKYGATDAEEAAYEEELALYRERMDYYYENTEYFWWKTWHGTPPEGADLSQSMDVSFDFELIDAYNMRIILPTAAEMAVYNPTILKDRGEATLPNWFQVGAPCNISGRADFEGTLESVAIIINSKSPRWISCEEGETGCENGSKWNPNFVGNAVPDPDPGPDGVEQLEYRVEIELILGDSVAAVVPEVAEVVQGATQVFEGFNFLPNEEVSGVVHSDPIDLAPQKADANGYVRFEFEIPSDFEEGTHTVTLTGETSKRVVTGEFAVAPAESAEPPEPGDGSDGTASDGTGSDGADVDSAAPKEANSGGELVDSVLPLLVLLVATGSVAVVARRRMN